MVPTRDKVSLLLALVCFLFSPERSSNPQPSPNLRPSPGICSIPSARARPWEPWSRRGDRSLPAPSCAYECPRWSHNPGGWREKRKKKKLVGISSPYKSVVRFLSASAAGGASDCKLLPRNQSQIVGRVARNCSSLKTTGAPADRGNQLVWLARMLSDECWNYTSYI